VKRTPDPVNRDPGGAIGRAAVVASDFAGTEAGADGHSQSAARYQSIVSRTPSSSDVLGA